MGPAAADQPGLGRSAGEDAYSIVNAGAPGRFDASDEAAGGAPGTVRDKVGTFGPHRERAETMLNSLGGIPAGGMSAAGNAKPSVETAQAGGIDPQTVQLLFDMSMDPHLDEQTRGMAGQYLQMLTEQQMQANAPITPYQQAQLGQGERRMAMDDAQFRAQHGLSVAEYERAGQQWAAEHGLNRDQFEENKAQFQADLGHRQDQLAEQQRQFDNPQPPKEVQLYEYGQANPGFTSSQFVQSDDALSRKVEALVSTGLDRNTATSIAAGRYSVSRDPINGTAQVVDKATGQVIGQAPPEAATVVEQAPEGGGLYGQTNEGTGFVSGVQELSSNTLGQLPGQVGDFFSFPETVETRQNFRNATSDLIRAFSLSPRYPVAEQQRIRDQLGVEPSAFEDPGALRSRMQSIDGYLRQRLEDEKAIAGDQSLRPSSGRMRCSSRAR